jgi:hypothetical protein
MAITIGASRRGQAKQGAGQAGSALAAALTRTIDEVRSGTEPDAARRAAARAAVAARFSIDSSRHYLAAALAGRPSAYDDSFHADAHAIEPQGR